MTSAARGLRAVNRVLGGEYPYAPVGTSATFRGLDHVQARRPEERRVIIAGRSTTLDNFPGSLAPILSWLAAFAR